MVQRTSRPGQLLSGALPDTIGPQGYVQATPDVQKFRRGKDSIDSLLDAVLPLGQQVAAKAWQDSTDRAYLEGVAKSAMGASEEDLEANPFTRAWAEAGHRDTEGRKEVAKSAAYIQEQMASIISKPDAQERFNALLQEQNAKVGEVIKGMSKQQRAATFAQQAEDIVAQQAQFTKKRAEWIIQQEEQSVQEDFTVRRNRLDDAKNNPQQYAAESKSFAVSVYRNIWQNPKLPQESRVALTKQALEYASSSDNYGVYEVLKRLEFQFDDGSTGTIMGKLPLSEQIKLDKVQREAQGRTQVIRAASFEDALARMRADDFNGVTYEDLTGVLQQATDANILKAGKRESITKEFFEAKAVRRDSTESALAFAAGDFSRISELGKTNQQALNDWLDVNKEMPYTKKVQDLLAIGYNSGIPEAFTKAGELMAPAIAQLGYGQDIDPNAASTVQNLVKALDISEGNNPGVYARTIQSLDNEGQNMLLFMREGLRSGITDPVTAVQYARAQQLKNGQQGGLIDSVRSTARREDTKAVLEIGDLQLLGSFSLNAKAFFSGDAAILDRFTTFRPWFADATRLAEVRANTQLEVSRELEIIAQTSPFLPQSARMSKALAAVAARTVDTASGPLTLDRGASVHEFFGAPAVADQEYIGKAIDQLVPLEGNQRIAWTPTPDGSGLVYRKYNADGGLIDNGVLNAKSVGTKVMENLQRDADEQANLIGPGKIVRKGGAQVQFNGENTAGVNNKHMLVLRDAIVDQEGISPIAYNDGKVVKGNQSFGVGISQTGGFFEPPKNPDGTYRQEQINQTFSKASNRAAEIAARSMQTVGVEGAEWLKLFGVLAYQSEASARNEDLLAYIALGNKESALGALRKTNAYKNSPDSRKQFYETQLQKAMK